MKWRMMLLLLIMGAATWALLGVAKTCGPHGPSAAALFDALALPGAILLLPLLPQGPDSGGMALYWGHAVVTVNVLVYAAAWYAAILMVRRLRAASPRSPPQ